MSACSIEISPTPLCILLFYFGYSSRFANRKFWLYLYVLLHNCACLFWLKGKYEAPGYGVVSHHTPLD
jgi:hypothetical protein